MEFFRDYLGAVLALFADAAPWLLMGFFLAGLLKILLPPRVIYRHLGGDRFKPVFLASLFGVPLPLCSCSVLPTAAALRKSGASKGATTSFLISTPETGLDSIGITWALLDPLMTIIRPVAALLTALFTGAAVNKFTQLGLDRDSGDDPSAEAAAGNGPAGVDARAGRRSVRRVLREAADYGFGVLLDDLASWFVIGFLLSGLVVVLLPDGFFTQHVSAGWASLFLMLLVGMPIYVCATAATPLAAAFILKGLDPGAALVFLLAGPATNITTILVVAKLLGRRIAVLYVAGVAVSALVLGAFVSAIYAGHGMKLATSVSGAVEGGPSIVTIAAAVILFLLVVRSAARTRMLAGWGERLRTMGRPLGVDPTGRAARGAVILLLALVYASSAFSVVRLGETGWVVRFGKVVRSVRAPGLVVHLPWPFARVDRVRDREVRGVDFGFSREAARTGVLPDRSLREEDGYRERRDLVAQSEVMTGEEYILRIRYAVHYAVRDAFRYRYRIADPDRIVSAFAEAALRRSAARRDSNEVLVTHREAVERETAGFLQADLDRAGCGVRVVGVTLRDVHAPPDVHFAYRDVASALEDKEREVRRAEAYQAETLAQARGRAAAEEQKAKGYASEKVEVATGEAKAFLARWKAYRESEEITRWRLFLAAAEKALAGARLILLLGRDVEVDLWKLRGTTLPGIEEK